MIEFGFSFCEVASYEGKDRYNRMRMFLKLPQVFILYVYCGTAFHQPMPLNELPLICPFMNNFFVTSAILFSQRIMSYDCCFN